ncbi:sterol O-acyltransferase 1 [Euwallacea fornicatus]|uniref:sterol O-acyltransferase 1 n=1 Tax=Euwallacea fornicatus TaxID=995702 RepID=UPI0033904C85
MGEIVKSSGSNSEVEQVKTNNERKQKVKPLPIRHFEIRDSLLTVLCQNPHIKVVKHIFVASLIALFLNTVLQDFFEHGEIRVGYKIITKGLGKIQWVLFIWLILNVCATASYLLYNFWAYVRINHIPPKGLKIQLWDTVWLIGLIAYYIFQFQAISFSVLYLMLPIGSSAIVCLEQTRLLMKIHAFMRSNIGRVLKHKPHSDKELVLPDLRHFYYFLMAPTLVYCDEYPRRDTIRWKYVLERVFELIGVFFYYAFLLEKFISPNLLEIGTRPFAIKELILLIFNNFIVGLMFLLLTFYVILDVTQNLIGELLRFGDRKFYEAWWTSTSYSEYFRNWNMVVGDWLYTYIYKDMYEHVIPGSKILAKLTVFVISAVVHEWILTCMFGFFFPALFLIFTFAGGALSFVAIPKVDILNVLFWYSLAFGSGMLTSLYAMECIVRSNVPIENSGSLIDYIVPRLFTCNCIIY